MKPNLLYIHSDQHSPSVLGCYGDPVVQTPHLDSIAARGIVFENVYCPSPICVPSRMAMLAGRHPHELEVWTNDQILDSSIPTLAHAMGAGGYQPVLIGRMHSNGPDQLHGYTDRPVGDHGPNHVGGSGVTHGILAGTAGPGRVSLEKSGPGQSAYEVHDDWVTAAAVDYLNQAGLQKRSGFEPEPFSLSVGFMLPHQPFVARREDYQMYEGRIARPRIETPYSDDLHPYFKNWREQCGIIEVDDEEMMRARTAYYGLVTAMDRMIGKILRALKENNLIDNTLIIYMSDHGEQIGEHGLWWKQTFYENSAGIPAIISWPGVLPEGERCRRVASSLDFNATMLDALEAPPLPNSDGRSLLPLLKGEDDSWEDVAFSEYCTNLGCLHRMVRQDEWKLNYYHGQPTQLFNLEEDPDELIDRSDDPACSEIVNELTAEVLDGWNPQEIQRKLEERSNDKGILTAWAKNTQPEDRYRWQLKPEMNFLDES